MKIPVVGGCMQAFGLARFSWAYSLTQQSGMPIDRSIEASLRATSNGAFIGQSPRICAAINAGEEFSDALAEARLFPDEFLEIVRVAETSGTVPEALERLSPQFEDQARRSLNALVAALSWLVWLLVAAFIVFVIFSIFMWYMDLLNSALDEVNG
jgi:type IV pilus assembly protein PilC